MGESVQERIQQVLAVRRRQQQPVSELLRRWEVLQQHHRTLRTAAEHLRGELAHLERGHSEHAELDAALTRFTQGTTRGAEPLERRIDDAVVGIRAALERVTRKTVNIGVSGRTKAGKSTLLRAISGLSENEIPSHRWESTTAVRSKIYHSGDGEAGATIEHYGFDEFRQRVLQPRLDYLRLAFTPAVPQDLANLPLDNDAEFKRRWAGNQEMLEPGRLSLLQRLREMKAALPSYVDQFDSGATQLTDFKELGPYVAYPERNGARRTDRKYLAVRDVHIRTRFPGVDVTGLGLIDLPGLGEVDPNIEQEHLRGLQNEVDVVLHLKNPANDPAVWADKDNEVLKLAYYARRGVELRDFVFLVINHQQAETSANGGRAVDGKVSGSFEKFQKTIELSREGVASQHVTVVGCDVSDGDEVRARILTPVLEHLAARLADMDGAALKRTLESSAATCLAVRSSVQALMESLHRCAAMLPLPEKRLYGLVKNLTNTLANHLVQLSRGYREMARQGTRNQDFDDAIETASTRVRDWLAGGFGQNDLATWRSMVEGQMVLRPEATAEQSCDAARLYVDSAFRQVGDSLGNQIAELRASVAGILHKHLTGELLPQPDDPAALDVFRERLYHESCPSMAEAVQGLTDLEMRYSSLRLRVIRPLIDRIRPRNLARWAAAPPAVTPGEATVADEATREVWRAPWGDAPLRAVPGERTTPADSEWPEAAPGERAGDVHPETDGAIASWYVDRLQTDLTELVTAVVEEIRNELRKDWVVTVGVLEAAALQFLDSFLRARDAEFELRQLCGSEQRRAAIWPEEFSGGPAAIHGKIIRLQMLGGELLQHSDTVRNLERTARVSGD